MPHGRRGIPGDLLPKSKRKRKREKKGKTSLNRVAGGEEERGRPLPFSVKGKKRGEGAPRYRISREKKREGAVPLRIAVARREEGRLRVAVEKGRGFAYAIIILHV